MKELTNQEKIELVEGAYGGMKGELERNFLRFRGICLWITLLAYNKDFLTYDEVVADGYRGHPARQLIPELLNIKPEGKETGGCWFGKFSKENVPARLEALERLLEILKSNKDERTVNA